MKYFRIKNNKKSVFKVKQLSTAPVVKKVHKSKQPGVDDLFEIEISCPVDKNELLQSNIKEIEAELSPKDISYFKNKGNSNSIKIEQNKIKDLKKENAKNPTEVSRQSKKLIAEMEKNVQTKAIENLGKNIRSKNSSLYSETKKIGKFVFSPASEKLNVLERERKKEKSDLIKKDIFGETKKITLVPVTSVEKTQLQKKVKDIRQQKNPPSDFRKTFKNFYNASIESALIDPASIFENSHNKRSLKEELKGKNPSFSKYSKDYKGVFQPVFKGLVNEIKDLSSDTQFKHQINRELNTIGNLKTTVKIPRNQLVSMGEKGNIILKARGNDKLLKQTNSYSFKVSDVLNEDNPLEKDYSVNAKRNSKTNSRLILGTDSKCSVSIHAKNVKKSTSYDRSLFKKIKSEFNVDKNEKSKLNNLTPSKKSSKSVKRNEDIFYRTTINYNGIDFSNAKARASRSLLYQNENTPHAALSVTINKEEASMNVDVKNISRNVVGVRVLKQRFNGKALKDYDFLIDSEGNYQKRFLFLEGKYSASFEDYDVFDDATYKYTLECMMKNGEIKKTHQTFIEKFEERSETVNFIDLSLEKETSGGVCNVEISFKLKKIENQVDDILKNLFGDVFNLFQKELNEIKDLSSLIYSVEIVKINTRTGEAKTIERITTNSETGEGFFKDSFLVNDSIMYKMIPKVLPAIEVISKINARIDSLGKEEVFNKVNNAFAANKRKQKNNKSNIVSKKTNIRNRSSVRRGLEITPAYDLEKNKLDFFGSSSTGDIHYFSPTSYVSNSFEITKAVIYEIKNKADRNKISDANYIQEQDFDLNITIDNDVNIDFYKIYIKEGNNIYLDGIMHATDETNKNKNYHYLISHFGSIGLIEYFIVPVDKAGNILIPKKLTSQVIE